MIEPSFPRRLGTFFILSRALLRQSIAARLPACVRRCQRHHTATGHIWRACSVRDLTESRGRHATVIEPWLITDLPNLRSLVPTCHYGIGTLFARLGDQGMRGAGKMKIKLQAGRRQEYVAHAALDQNGRKPRKSGRRGASATIAQRYVELLRLREKISEVESWHPR